MDNESLWWRVLGLDPEKTDRLTSLTVTSFSLVLEMQDHPLTDMMVCHLKKKRETRLDRI